MSSFNKDVQSDHIWPGASRSRRIRGIPDASIEAVPIDFFVRRGYVYVVGAVRGTGKSGGTYNYLGPQEIDDARGVIEWAGSQEWCNGNVGMAGIGYFATHHAQVALLEPPHLKCIAPVSAFWDVYNYFWYPGGILSSGFLTWLISSVNMDVHKDEKVLLKSGHGRLSRSHSSCSANKDISADPLLVAALSNPDLPTNGTVENLLITHPAWSQYWAERAVMDYSKIKIPAYIVAASHRPAIFYHWSEMTTPRKLLNCPSGVLPTGRSINLPGNLLRWYDFWLKGKDTGIMDEPNVRLFVQNANEWLEADDFPISRHQIYAVQPS